MYIVKLFKKPFPQLPPCWQHQKRVTRSFGIDSLRCTFIFHLEMHFTCYFNHWTAQLLRNVTQTWNQSRSFASRQSAAVNAGVRFSASDISLVASFVQLATPRELLEKFVAKENKKYENCDVKFMITGASWERRRTEKPRQVRYYNKRRVYKENNWLQKFMIN